MNMAMRAFAANPMRYKGKHFRNEMPGDNIGAAAPHLPGRTNVKALFEAQGLGTDGFADGGPHETRQDQRQKMGGWTKERRHEDQNHDGGCGQEHIGQTHEQQIRHTFEPSGKGSQQHPQKKGRDALITPKTKVLRTA
jgi:hypothetical protein